MLAALLPWNWPRRWVPQDDLLYGTEYVDTHSRPGHHLAIGSWRIQFTRPPGWRRGPWFVRGNRTQRLQWMRVIVAPWLYLDYSWGQSFSGTGATLILPVLSVAVWRIDWTPEDRAAALAEEREAWAEDQIDSLDVAPLEETT